MYRMLFFLTLLLTAGIAMATEGYALLKNGDTVHGKIRLKWNRNGTTVVVKGPEGKRYIAAEQVSVYKWRGRKMKFGKSIHARRSQLEAMEVVEEGEVTLLMAYCRASRYSYDLYVLLEDGRLVYIWEDSYRNTILHHFHQSPAFKQKVTPQQIVYSTKRRGYLERMRTLVKLYNQ